MGSIETAVKTVGGLRPELVDGKDSSGCSNEDSRLHRLKLLCECGQATQLTIGMAHHQGVVDPFSKALLLQALTDGSDPLRHPLGRSRKEDRHKGQARHLLGPGRHGPCYGGTAPEL